MQLTEFQVNQIELRFKNIETLIQKQQRAFDVIKEALAAQHQFNADVMEALKIKE